VKACSFSPYATVEMASDMAGRLSPLDRREIRAASGMQPGECLRLGVETSAESVAYLLDGRAYALGGVIGDGRIWLLTARDIKSAQARWFFARRCRDDLADMLTRWPRLYNRVYAKNAPHVRLLRWLGFEFGEPEGDFLPFEMARERVNV